MDGGTYAEALKAGFTTEQAGFLGRMSGETKDEAVERMFKELDERTEQRRRKLYERLTSLPVMTTATFVFGLAAGLFLR